MLQRNIISGLGLMLLIAPALVARDVILEFKGAYALPTNSSFRDCYKGTALFGPELTFQLVNNRNWYGFASLDYLSKKGKRLSICDSTKLKQLPLAVGLKYFVPIRDRADFYFGLGFQPIHLRTKSTRGCVVEKHGQWGFGGIAKMGTYINLPRNFVVDFFVDYSFAWTDNIYGHTVAHSKSNIGKAIFGTSLGYRF